MDTREDQSQPASRRARPSATGYRPQARPHPRPRCRSAEAQLPGGLPWRVMGRRASGDLSGMGDRNVPRFLLRGWSLVRKIRSARCEMYTLVPSASPSWDTDVLQSLWRGEKTFPEVESRSPQATEDTESDLRTRLWLTSRAAGCASVTKWT